MDSASTPWAERFEKLLDAEAIRKGVAVGVPPLVGLNRLPTELATKQLETALKTVFFPTSQCVTVLQRFVGVAYAHCRVTYPSLKAFMAGVYAEEVPLEKFSAPICLTGLGGTGKTELIRAFIRLQGMDSAVEADDKHPPFPLNVAWLVTILARSTPKDVLVRLSNKAASPSELVEVCRKLAFRDGVPFLCADEFQFATGSSSANARVTQMLYCLAYIGIPFVYVANFSLLRRLQKRPEEDQQRLLSDPIVLLPEACGSEDWVMTLRSQQSVAPDVLLFDPVNDAKNLHTFTAGRKRAMVRLAMIAFRTEHRRGGVVDFDALRRAYHSEQFARYREESEILASQLIRNAPDKIRNDLWCPIPLPKGAEEKFLDTTLLARRDQVAEFELRSALTGKERRSAEEIERTITKRGAKAGSVFQLDKGKKASSEELKRNASWLKNNL